MLSQHYVELIEMKRWADGGLLEVAGDALERLTPADAGLLLRVLDHIHAVDEIFQHHLQGRPHGYKAARSDQVPSFQALADGTREVDDWYVDYVRGLRAKAFEEAVDFVFTSGKTARMTRGQILLHVCLHGGYHRGNAGALLQLRGLAPGRDGITDFLAEAA